MLSGYTVPHDGKETKLGNSDQEASLSAGKNTGIVLVPYRAWKCVPTAISSGVEYFRRPCVSFVTTDAVSVTVTKITSRIGVS